METGLDKDIKYSKGVGPKMAEKLHRLGIETVSDLIFHWPRAYVDYTDITKIGDIGNFKQIQSSNYRNSSQSSTSNNKAVLNIVRAEREPNNNNRTIEQPNNYFTIRGRILGISNKLTAHRHMKITEAVVEDGTGSLKLVWFNQPFLKEYLRPGSEWYFRGKVSFDPFNGGLMMESPMRRKEPAIVPVYPETKGINSNYIAKLVESVRSKVESVEDFLPAEVIDQSHLVSLKKAISDLHFPKSLDHLGRARKRVAFDELFLISLRAKIGRQEIEKATAPVININEKLIKVYVLSLPFSLTDDQKKATWQILQDMSGGTVPLGGQSPWVRPMNRLLNGDVGSGKTVVAAIAAYMAVKSGYRAVLMVPTEVLAIQHYETLSKLFAKEKITIGLLTSSMKRVSFPCHSERSEESSEANNDTPRPVGARSFANAQDDTAKKNQFKLKPQDAGIVIGTQALLQKKVDLGKIGLIIIDEQHRFGVRQRALLKEKTDGERKPHFLSMTATPIPRTLHLSLFGDLDISVILEKPKNRKEIKTRYVEPQNRTRAYEFIRNQIKNGRQAFVVCPLIDESRETSAKSQELFDVDRKSVMKEYEKLRNEIFPEYKVVMLHGKMKSKEKDEILSHYAAGKSDVLVSTSVIEVGIDVPNATVMMIEDAERFGLAQIHQFRGRVGRAEHQSFCFLFSSSQSQNALIRLRSLENVSDGFKLAEIDLEMRGPGDMFGTMQSGQLELKMASFSDRILIEEASSAADKILRTSRDLSKFPRLMEKLAEFENSKHLE